MPLLDTNRIIQASRAGAANLFRRAEESCQAASGPIAKLSLSELPAALACESVLGVRPSFYRIRADVRAFWKEFADDFDTGEYLKAGLLVGGVGSGLLAMSLLRNNSTPNVRDTLIQMRLTPEIFQSSMRDLLSGWMSALTTTRRLMDETNQRSPHELHPIYARRLSSALEAIVRYGSFLMNDIGRMDSTRLFREQFRLLNVLHGVKILLAPMPPHFRKEFFQSLGILEQGAFTMAHNLNVPVPPPGVRMFEYSGRELAAGAPRLQGIINGTLARGNKTLLDPNLAREFLEGKGTIMQLAQRYNRDPLEVAASIRSTILVLADQHIDRILAP